MKKLLKEIFEKNKGSIVMIVLDQNQNHGNDVTLNKMQR